MSRRLSLADQLIESVCDGIRYPELRQSIGAELRSHIDASAQELLLQGLSEEEAEKAAIARIGEPSRLASQFNRIYQPRWDWVHIGGSSLLMVAGAAAMFRLEPVHALQNLGWLLLGTVLAAGLCSFDPGKLRRLAQPLFVLTLLFLCYAAWKGERHLSLPYLGMGPLPWIGRIWINPLDLSLFPLIPALAGILVERKSQGAWRSLGMLAVLSLPILYYLLNHSAVHALLYAASGTAILRASRAQKREVLAFALLSLSLLPGLLEPGRTPAVPGQDLSSDFVFLTLVRTYGPIAGAALLITGALLLIRWAASIGGIRDPFGRSVAAGIATLFALEFAWHILINLGLAPSPMEGIKLPLISYGGTHGVAQIAALGLFLGIVRRKSWPAPASCDRRRASPGF